MPELPHDLDDLRLAPVLLHLDDRLEELGALSVDELGWRVALDSDLPDWDAERRRHALMVTLSRDIDLGSWELSWDDRGVRVAHGTHQVVLGLPDSVSRYAMLSAGLPNR